MWLGLQGLQLNKTQVLSKNNTIFIGEFELWGALIIRTLRWTQSCGCLQDNAAHRYSPPPTQMLKPISAPCTPSQLPALAHQICQLPTEVMGRHPHKARGHIKAVKF